MATERTPSIYPVGKYVENLFTAQKEKFLVYNRQRRTFLPFFSVAPLENFIFLQTDKGKNLFMEQLQNKQNPLFS